MADDLNRAEAKRIDALNRFLDARVRKGYRIETHTDTHAIIAPRGWRSWLPQSGRQVISVDDEGTVTTERAVPIRS